MLDNDTPDLGAGYDRTAVDGEATEAGAIETEPDTAAETADETPAEDAAPAGDEPADAA